MMQRRLEHREARALGSTLGLRTVGALAVAAVILASAAAAAAQGNLSPSEQTQVVEKAREVALQYTAKLPNFICTQTIRRSLLPKRSQTWKLLDTVAVDVAFSDQGERYNLLSVDGKPTKKKFKEIGGMQSDSEFGTLLQWIFQTQSQTKFQWERVEELRGRPASVFSYRIEKDRSKFEISTYKRTFVVSTPVRMFAAFGGLIYIDRETHRVLKLTAVPSGIPADWQITAVSQELDYGFTEINGQPFFLPLHAQMFATLRDGGQTRNEIEFGNYRQFSSEAILKFEP